MPDKIWLHKNTKYDTGDIVCGYQYEFAQEIECEGIENFVEYVPIDTFIKKACEWLESVNLYFYEVREGVFSETLVEDFRDYMEKEED